MSSSRRQNYISEFSVVAGKRGYVARTQKYTDVLFRCFLFSDFSLIFVFNAKELRRALRKAMEMIPDKKCSTGNMERTGWCARTPSSPER